MPPENNVGRGGTLAVEDFESLESMASLYNEKVLASKVAKICSKRADYLKHEYAGSSISLAFASTASKIKTAVGEARGMVPTETFENLADMVMGYGPELVIQKLGKLAKRNGRVAESTVLKAIFPRN